MKITDFAKVVDKTIPTDLDPDYDVDYGYGTVLFDDELELDGSVVDRFIGNRIRLVVVQSEYLIFEGQKVKDDSSFTVYLYAYDKDDGYGAIAFDGSMNEISDLGGMDDFIYEIVTNEKGLFIDRGSSVCTGDFPEISKGLDI